MAEIEGALVVLTRAVHAGTETIVGHVIPPMMIEETAGGGEEVTHVTVEGMVTQLHIPGLPLPLEPETPVIVHMVPVKSRHPHLMRLEIL